MSDVNLLAAGGIVTFISVAGFYVYVRSCWTVKNRGARTKHAQTTAPRAVQGRDAA